MLLHPGRAYLPPPTMVPGFDAIAIRRIAELALEPDLEAVLLDVPDRGRGPGRLDRRPPDGFPQVAGRLAPRKDPGVADCHPCPARPRASPSISTPGRGRPLAGTSMWRIWIPPYNQHSYRGNYHVWETLVRSATGRRHTESPRSAWTCRDPHRVAISTASVRMPPPPSSVCLPPYGPGFSWSRSTTRVSWRARRD